MDPIRKEQKTAALKHLIEIGAIAVEHRTGDTYYATDLGHKVKSASCFIDF